jgi:DNA-binding transcriptional LysR family regulator
VDRLHEMEVFVAVADAGGFAKAGARLRISPPAVTRAVSSLEARLGARLIQRTTRSLSLTEAGRRYLESARRLLAEIGAAEGDALGESAAPSGHLSVTASVAFGRSALAPVVCAFLREHSCVSASVLLVDRVVDLVEEGIDVAVRIGQLPDSSLVARRVGEVRRLLVASPAYLAKRGRPAAPAELKHHDLIAFTGLTPSGIWRLGEGRSARKVAVNPRLELNDAAAALSAAEAGEGITVALSYMVASAVAAGCLATVLDRFMPPAVPVQLVYPHSRLVAAKVRAFVDFAAPRLREGLACTALDAPAPARRRRARPRPR